MHFLIVPGSCHYMYSAAVTVDMQPVLLLYRVKPLLYIHSVNVTWMVDLLLYMVELLLCIVERFFRW